MRANRMPQRMIIARKEKIEDYWRKKLGRVWGEGGEREDFLFSQEKKRKEMVLLLSFIAG